MKVCAVVDVNESDESEGTGAGGSFGAMIVELHPAADTASAAIAHDATKNRIASSVTPPIDVGIEVAATAN